MAVASGGVLIVNRPRPQTAVPVCDGVADIEARATWLGVERELLEQGFSAPVLPDTLWLSVGGTVSVGGFGARSIRSAAQIDNVVSLRIVLPDGTPVEADADNNAELFSFALAGLGSIGVIERVRMRVLPAAPYSRVFISHHQRWAELLASLEEITRLPVQDSAEGCPAELTASMLPNGSSYLRRRYYFNAAQAAEMAGKWSPPKPIIFQVGPIQTRSQFADSDDIDSWLAQFPGTYKVWADYLLDFDDFRALVEEVERRVHNRHPGHRHLASVYVLAVRTEPMSGERRSIVAPLSPTAGGKATHRFGCGLYHMVPHGDQKGLASALAACDELTALCIELGGRPYLHGSIRMSHSLRRRVYGADYDRLLVLRAKLDPDGLFNAGWFNAASH